MSALDSTSTIAEAKAAYFDNASYEEDASAAKARAFVTACRFLLLMLPKRSKHGSAGEVELDPVQIRQQLVAAQSWTAANDTTSVAAGEVRYADFGSLRE